MDRRLFLMGPAALAVPVPASAPASSTLSKPPMRTQFAKPSEIIPLWTGEPPIKPMADMTEAVEVALVDKVVYSRRMHGITRPRMAVFRPRHANGSAILICPGGGFGYNYFDLEGYDLASVLVRNGVTCFVLFYRLANDNWADRANVGTVDAQRAVRTIRANAARLELDPERVGAIGFSAGGFVAASLATRQNEAIYPVQDSIDALDARPDLAALIYGVLSLDPAIAWRGANSALFRDTMTEAQERAFSPDRRVSSATPPTFLVHAEDDTAVPPANSLRFRDALKANNVVVETHLFASGGHGFGMKPPIGETYEIWPSLLLNFAKRMRPSPLASASGV